MSKPTSPISRLKAAFEGILRSPFRLRAVIGVTLLCGWYFAVYRPIVAETEAMTRRLNTERKRLDLGVQIEDLRRLTKRFQERLAQSSDQNEVVQYLMGGIRQHPIKLVSLVPKSTSELGPYKLVQVDVSVEGNYANLEALVRWIETDPHLFRIEQIQIEPARAQTQTQAQAQAGSGQGDVYSLGLTVVGIYG